MRFDPKVVRAGEAPLTSAGDIELPPHLAALGQQLGDDAAHLAACYPPAKSMHLNQAAASSWRKRATIAVAVFCTSALAIVMTLAALLQGPSQVASTTYNENPVSAAPSFTSVLPASDVTVSLVGLSGPELEAWLDLLDHEPAHPISVSF